MERCRFREKGVAVEEKECMDECGLKSGSVWL